MIGPFFDPGWIADHLDELSARTLEHLQLTLIAVIVGFAVSFPVAIYCHRHPRIYPPVTWVAGVLYTIPSLALFAFLASFPAFGLSIRTAEVGLISYTLLILIRNTVAGLEAVPKDVKEAAQGMGYSSRQILWRIELPLAIPVIVAGLRIATVTTIGLVTVTSLIGMGGLGYFILQGLSRFYSTTIIVGSVLSIVLAILADVLLIYLERRLTPWSKKHRSVTA